jgi:hypothetical protein
MSRFSHRLQKDFNPLISAPLTKLPFERSTKGIEVSTAPARAREELMLQPALRAEDATERDEILRLHARKRITLFLNFSYVRFSRACLGKMILFLVCNCAKKEGIVSCTW